MSWYGKIIKHINFPIGLYIRGQGKFYQHFRDLEKNQWLPIEDLETLQWKRLKKLLKHAKKSPYWKKILKGKTIKSIQDLQKLPVMTKQNLQNYLEEMTIRPEHKVIENATGGSTGEPTIFYQDRERNYHRAMDQLRHDRWAGWDVGEKVGLLWGANHDLKAYTRISGRIANTLFFQQIPLDAFELTASKMKRYLKILKRKKPPIIQAYAQAITTFADFIKEKGLSVKPLQLCGIISSAEKLYPKQRKRIEKVFGCPVFDRYGSREVGLIASDCDHFEGMHINADNVLVEFLDEKGNPVKPGELGRIVVTDLWNMVTPFIRYDTGDMGTSKEGQCSCGRGLPLMKEVVGRESDFIKLRNGKMIHGEYFTHLFYGVRGLERFQMIQKSFDRLEFKIVKNDDFDPKKMDAIIKKMKEFLEDPSIEIDIQYVERIMTPQSGKRRFTISEFEAN